MSSQQQELDTISGQISSIQQTLLNKPLTQVERNQLGIKLQPLLKRKFELEHEILFGR